MGDYYGPAAHERQLIATIDAQEQRIATLEAALRPFAEEAKKIPANYPDHYGWPLPFVADIQAAAKALENR